MMTATGTPEFIVVKDHLADIIDLLAGNAPVITQFSNHLFSSGLIPKEVHLNPKSSPLDRATQLVNSVFSTIGTHSNPSSVFRGLVTSLEKVGLTDMAKKLQQSLGVKAYLPQPLKAAVDQSPTVIQLSSKDEVARNIDKLYDQFTDLVTDLRTRFEELISGGKVKLIQVTRQAAEYLRSPVTSLQANSIDELFDSLQPHYDFLNCSLLKKVTNKFLSGDELQFSLSQYIDSMEKLLELSQLKHIHLAIKEKLSFLPTPTANGHTGLIVFKLHGRWEELALKNFKRVLSHYFRSDADLFSHIYFEFGSLIVKMLIPTSILQFVTNRLTANKDSLNRLGIFEVAINGKTIWSINDTDINFEKSLMNSRYDFEATMLLRLGANPYNEDALGNRRKQLAINSEDRADFVSQQLSEIADTESVATETCKTVADTHETVSNAITDLSEYYDDESILIKLGANSYSKDDATNDSMYECLIEDEDKRFHKAQVACEKFKKTLAEAIDFRKDTIKHLQKLIEEKDKYMKTIIGGTIATVTGSTLGILGFATGFFTFGLGFGLAAGSLVAAGGLAAVGGLVNDYLDLNLGTSDICLIAQKACEKDRKQAANIEEYGDELDSHLKALASKYKMSKGSIFGYFMSTKGSLAPDSSLTTSYSDFYGIIRQPKPCTKEAEAPSLTIKRAFCIGNVVMDVVFVPFNLNEVTKTSDGIKSMMKVLEKNLEEMVLFQNELNTSHSIV